MEKSLSRPASFSTKQTLVDLERILGPDNHKERIELKDFIQIFEKDSFGEKAISAIKRRCAEKARKQTELDRLRSLKHGSTHAESVELISLSSSALSPFAGRSRQPKSNSRDQTVAEKTPSIKELDDVTAEWWQEINPNQDQEVPILVVKKFFTANGISPDLDAAEKTIMRKLGHKAERLDFADFYKLFCLSIFKVALVDMLNEIEKMSLVNQELPLVVKLATYRRARFLSGLDNSMSQE